jgi:hypothetical protein
MTRTTSDRLTAPYFAQPASVHAPPPPRLPTPPAGLTLEAYIAELDFFFYASQAEAAARIAAAKAVTSRPGRKRPSARRQKPTE